MNAWRRPCRTAWIVKTMLFFWLFSLAAGWANACLVQPALDHDAQAAPHGAAWAVAGAEHHDDPGPGLDACLSFCDSEQSIVPKLKLPVLADLDAPAPAAAATWTPSMADRVPYRGRRLAMPPPEPPVSIRFLRLTI
jgi:hypothetical protein